MKENKLYCSHCGALIEDDDYEEVNGEIVCTECIVSFFVGYLLDQFPKCELDKQWYPLVNSSCEVSFVVEHFSSFLTQRSSLRSVQGASEGGHFRVSHYGV